ncbi:MAG: hypothetical protein HC831_12115 [Chloroflexia bacterium]|nr:hypothetical protein [Chloroflexia bacterium]
MDQEENSSIKYADTNKVWLQHKKTFTKFWDSADAARIQPISKWARDEVKVLADSVKSLFYPFSGPDFIHANIFFPNAEKIVMLGLERVGKVPEVHDLSDKKLDTFLKAVRQSLDSIFIWGYFMTNDMRKDFASSLELQGLTPVIMLTIAKSGFEIDTVKRITLNSQGKVVGSLKGSKDNDSPWDTYISGVELSYNKPGEKMIRKLYYFSHDASDKSMNLSPGFTKFLASQKFDATYLKAASYLCNSFATVRKFALDVDYVFQDASGLLYSYFDKKTWYHQLWGGYTRPIYAFKWAQQNDLKKAYVSDSTIQDIPFKIGYSSRIGKSNLMLFTKKK